MYFPENMTFQYFFFDTYMGYFLQIIPIALVAGGIYFFYKANKTPNIPKGIIALSSLFVCYITSLIALTLFSEIIGDIYFSVLHHTRFQWNYNWLCLTYNFTPTFISGFSGESLGNILLFLPFGILYPMYNRESDWKRILMSGFLTSLVIENIQPLMDRAFDINDLILNFIGVIVGLLIYIFAKFLKNLKSN